MLAIIRLWVLIMILNRLMKVDITALVVALLALILTIGQAYVQRLHNHISVQPRVNAYFTALADDGGRGIYLVNNGLGSGFVKSVRVSLDGVEVGALSGSGFVDAVLLLGFDITCFVIRGPRPNDSFRVGEEIGLIALMPNARAGCESYSERFSREIGKRLTYTISFESIYGDSFEYASVTNTQISTK